MTTITKCQSDRQKANQKRLGKPLSNNFMFLHQKYNFLKHLLLIPHHTHSASCTDAPTSPTVYTNPISTAFSYFQYCHFRPIPNIFPKNHSRGYGMIMLVLTITVLLMAALPTIYSLKTSYGLRDVEKEQWKDLQHYAIATKQFITSYGRLPDSLEELKEKGFIGYTKNVLGEVAGFQKTDQGLTFYVGPTSNDAASAITDTFGNPFRIFVPHPAQKPTIVMGGFIDTSGKSYPMTFLDSLGHVTHTTPVDYLANTACKLSVSVKGLVN